MESASIAYFHAPDLGVRRSGVPGEERFGCLRVQAFRSYAAWMSSSEWQHALADARARDNPCFMCAETLPWRRHRRLIADLLAAFDVSGTRIAIARADGTFYAFGDTCTHLGCSLAEGSLGGAIVTCPCHGSQFDVTTGDVVRGPAREPVGSFPVRLEGDALRVDV